MDGAEYPQGSNGSCVRALQMDEFCCWDSPTGGHLQVIHYGHTPPTFFIKSWVRSKVAVVCRGKIVYEQWVYDGWSSLECAGEKKKDVPYLKPDE